MFGKYNITVTPNSRISLLCNNMCHAHVMLHNESVNKNMKINLHNIYSTTKEKTLNSTQLG